MRSKLRNGALSLIVRRVIKRAPRHEESFDEFSKAATCPVDSDLVEPNELFGRDRVAIEPSDGGDEFWSAVTLELMILRTDRRHLAQEYLEAAESLERELRAFVERERSRRTTGSPFLFHQCRLLVRRFRRPPEPRLSTSLGSSVSVSTAIDRVRRLLKDLRAPYRAGPGFLWSGTVLLPG